MNAKALKVAYILVMLSCLVIALTGCGSSSSSDSTPVASTVQVVDCSTVTSAATVTATASNTFSPQTVTVAPNGVVKWISASNVAHTVTSGTAGTANGLFNQNLSASGSSVCLKFTTAGTFNYYCTFHYTMGMTGTVTVQ